ncbi:HD-GYP domain-containing protein [Geomonas anaerohicana]|uniref:HD domain-containing protein n=1 Tax=Geomonas anaerohicana TaxID=2798583 RepID=A0ABS0Y9F4_9BACT|nr:HD domain-containing phosphohydrolase [Geomonas anaerohicana]MBJ6748930.1 HD domain-containing protein [Geomonas anaerohicana]
MVLERDREPAGDELARLGKTLVSHFFVLLKSSVNYGAGHAAVVQRVGNLLEVLRAISGQHDDAALVLKSGHLYLGEFRLRPDIASFEGPRYIMELMRRHHLGSITFGPGVTSTDLQRFVYLLQEPQEDETDCFQRLVDAVQQRGIGNLELDVLREDEVLSITPQLKRLRSAGDKVRPLYRKLLTTMDEVAAEVASGRRLRLRESKRVVQQIVDLLYTHEADLLGLSTMRSHDSSSQHHAANVCILSLVVGKRLGMNKFHLCELGLAALFHDIGNCDVPVEILDKAGELSPDERALMEKHPLYGVRKVMKLKGLDDLTARIITGIFEHHLMADFSGYPRLGYRKLGLLGRIISIADSYDGLTSSRISGRTAYPPHKALRVMLSQSGKSYDQALLKVFVGCVGIHPVGSLLLLDDKDIAVVVGNSEDPAQWDNPLVRIIADREGRETEGGEVIALGSPGSPQTITAVLDPYLYDLDVSRYF